MIDTIPPHSPTGCTCGNADCVGKSPEERAQLRAERAHVMALVASRSPVSGPTYTDLAREVDKLRQDAADSARYQHDASSRALRMGQQQGAAELATTLVEMLDAGASLKEVRAHLQHLLENDQ